MYMYMYAQMYIIHVHVHVHVCIHIFVKDPLQVFYVYDWTRGVAYLYPL